MKLNAHGVIAAVEALVAADTREDLDGIGVEDDVRAPARLSRNGEARGFDALDIACTEAARSSAVVVFAVQWGIFRGTAAPPEVDPFAAAIVAHDLDQVKELIGTVDAAKLRIDVGKPPIGLPRWSWKEVSLLEIAAAVGGRCCVSSSSPEA
jgi:hypothetical protein